MVRLPALGNRPIHRSFQIVRFGDRCLFWSVCCLSMLLCCDRAVSSPVCSVSMTPIAFGTIDVLAGASIDTTATLTVTCTGGAAGGDRICISLGAGSSGDATSRKLNGPSSNALRYDLYSDSARTSLWGSWHTGYDTSGVQVDVGNGSTTNLTVYARVFGSQPTAAAGSYSSTFTTDPYIQYDDKGSTACPTGALTASTSTSASATVNANCNISTTTLNFGSSPATISSNIDSTATITAQCTNTTPYSIGIGSGTNASGSQNRMRLGATSSYINYNLYTDAARSLTWTTTSSTTSCTGGAGTCVLGTGTGSNQGVTIYGRAPAQTAPAIGTYNDTVVITVTF